MRNNQNAAKAKQQVEKPKQKEQEKRKEHLKEHLKEHIKDIKDKEKNVTSNYGLLKKKEEKVIIL
jgi:hypothetical protein